MHLRSSFNILCSRFSLTINILLEFVKVLWKINEVHNLDVMVYQKACYANTNLLSWKKWLFCWSTIHVNLSASTLDEEGTWNAPIASRLQTKNKTNYLKIQTICRRSFEEIRYELSCTKNIFFILSYKVLYKSK